MNNQKIDISKYTHVCFWWLNDQEFKIVVENLSLKLKIGVLKILILIAILKKGQLGELKISSEQLAYQTGLTTDIIIASLYWLSKLNVIMVKDEAHLTSQVAYTIHYSEHEQRLRDKYSGCWVNLKSRHVLKLVKSTLNDQEITYEAMKNYLYLIKSNKESEGGYQHLYFDEELCNGHFKGTWRELLVDEKLIEFWGAGM